MRSGEKNARALHALLSKRSSGMTQEAIARKMRLAPAEVDALLDAGTAAQTIEVCVEGNGRVLYATRETRNNEARELWFLAAVSYLANVAVHVAKTPASTMDGAEKIGEMIGALIFLLAMPLLYAAVTKRGLPRREKMRSFLWVSLAMMALQASDWLVTLARRA
jgi:hypothetical protein